MLNKKKCKTKKKNKRKKNTRRRRKFVATNPPLCSVKILDPIILASFGTLGFVRLERIEAPVPNVDTPVRSFTCCAPMSTTTKRQEQHSSSRQTHRAPT